MTTEYNPLDPNAEVEFDTTGYERRQEMERIQAIDTEFQRQQEMELQEEESGAAQGQKLPQPKTEQPKTEEKKEQGGVLDNLNQFIDEESSRVDRQREEGFTTDNMSGSQRAVAGTIDTVMDLTSKFIPAMQGPADWWDEQSGRKDEADPMKKAERDASAIIMPMLLTGGLVGGATRAAGLTGKTKLMTDALISLGIDVGITATSDTTSDPGNLGSFVEGQVQKIAPNVTIPWASRDGDSPDVIYWKNMAESLVLAGADPIVTALYGAKAGNKIVPKNDIAQSLTDSKPPKPSTPAQAVEAQAALKESAQLEEGRRVLREDPEGVNGYNAFVNEPAEAAARVTLDETANTVDFMADQARIQNNVGTYNGRARPALDDATQELLSRADAPIRARILNKLKDELGAKFDLVVGGKKLTAKEVATAVDNLYDAAIAPLGKTFDDAVKTFNDLEVRVGNMTDSIASPGQRKVIGRAVDRLIDALSPQTQRASAVVQAQTGNAVSDIARNVELMEPVVDTSRLQELMMPRLRTLLKEQATSRIADSMASQLQAGLKKQAETIEGALKIDDKTFEGIFDAYTEAVDVKARAIDDFVDNLTEMAKENPSFLRPVYRLWAKTNGDVDSMYKLNQYLSNKVGVLRKAIVDGNPEVPSLLLREMQAARTANLINGTAPATAWIGNFAAVAVRPLTQLAGSVPVGIATGEWKQLQRSLNAFGQFKETWRRASKMARDEWALANNNPDAAMARGRKDYDFSPERAKSTLAEFEEMEELAETFGPGRKALWNATKVLNYWNGKNLNRWGVNAMYSADGFLKSMMASFDARLKAYDDVMLKNNGAFKRQDFLDLEKQLYDQAFDADGVLKDGYAKFASQEIALNADVAGIEAIEKAMDKFPILKGIFMFPRTRINAISVVQTFDPTGALSLWNNRSWRTISANAGDQNAVKAVLEMHGMKGGSVDDFLMLKSEYIGRKMASSALIMGGAMTALQGNLTGSGGYMSPADKQRAIRAGFKPYMIHGRSYENAPDWIKLGLSLTADITNAFAGTNGEGAEDWFRAVSSALTANVGNMFFGNEVEALSGLINGDKGAVDRYLAGMVDSMIPGAGARSALNNVVTPQLQDVEQNFLAFLANRNRWITDPLLQDDIDPFTGEPIYGNIGPLEGLVGRVLPFWNTKGGTEPWRAWMLETGWTGLSKPMVNPDTGEKLDPKTRQWINKWIGENKDWDKKMEEMMTWDEGRFAKEWKSLGAGRAKLDIKKSYVHEVLDDYKKMYFREAWEAWRLENTEAREVEALRDIRNEETYRGNYDTAIEAEDAAQELVDQMKQKY